LFDELEKESVNLEQVAAAKAGSGGGQPQDAASPKE
jgi:hypothetical protein